MDNTLTATGSSGSQSQTQDPQAATGTNGSVAQTNSLQPEPTSDALTSSDGVTLRAPTLPAVRLSGRNTTTASAVAPIVKHHANPILLGFSGILIVVAIVLVWAISRPQKDLLN